MLKKTLVVLAILAVSVGARASEIWWIGSAIEPIVTDSCTPTGNNGNPSSPPAQTYTTMNCISGAPQGFALHGATPPDSGLTMTLHVFWKTSSASNNAVKWMAHNAVCTSNLSGCLYDEMNPQATVEGATANLGSEILMETTLPVATLWNEATLASCAGTQCRSKPFLLIFQRNDDSPVNPGTAEVVAVRAVF